MVSESPNSQRITVVQQLWQELLAGSLKIASVHDDGFELVLANAAAPAPTPRRRHRQACFDTALRGALQKTLAADFELAPSTLSSLVRKSAAGMGVDVPFSRIPAALPLLAHAAQSACVVSLCGVGAERAPNQLWKLSFSYPEKLLEAALSRAELDVVERYLRAQSYPQIAAARGVSQRTIANQLARSFEKLRASGRLALLRNLVERGALAGAPVTLILRALPRFDTRAA
jgi:DNA-binding CsgD family transcriptional regulator